MTPAINKGTVVSKGALKATAPGGSAVKTAEKVSFSYTYKGGKFSAEVSIQNPSSSLTGLAFVGRDGRSHYYSLGGGTIDISALVKQAARNAAGPAGSSGGSGSGGSGGSSGSGSGSGGSAGPGGSGTGSGSGQEGTGSGSGSSQGGTGSGSRGSDNTGSSTGGASGGTDEEEDVTINDHAQDKTDIRDSITEITSPGTSSDPNKNNSQDDKPPCVLRRIWG